MKKIKTANKVITVCTLITVTDGYFLSGRSLAQTGFGNPTFNHNPQNNSQRNNSGNITGHGNNSGDGNRRGLHNNNGHPGSVYIRGPRNPWGAHFGRYTKSGRM